VEVVASLSQGRKAAAQCGLFTYKSVPVIFEPPCTYWNGFLYNSFTSCTHLVKGLQTTTTKNNQTYRLHPNFGCPFEQTYSMLTKFTTTKGVGSLGAFAKLQKMTTSFVMSVCPSVRPSVRMENLCSYSMDFYEIWHLSIFPKSVEKFQVQ